MKVILLETVEGLGERGDVVRVAPGYGRNYLIPRRKALPARDGNFRVLEQETRTRMTREQKTRREAETLAARLMGVSVTAAAQAGEDDRLHGAVTTQEIADLLQAQEFPIDKHQIVLPEPLRALGVYEVAVKLFQDVSATVKVWVVRE